MRASILAHAVVATMALGVGGWALALLTGWWVAGPPLMLALTVVVALTVLALGALPKR